MAGEEFVELAVLALRDALAIGIPEQLREIETRQSLPANSIPNPIDVVQARIPNDNRSPLVAVYEEGWNGDQRLGLLVVDCTVLTSVLSPTAAELVTVSRLSRRYVSAVLRAIRANPTLRAGGDGPSRVTAAILKDGDAAAGIGDRSATRLVTAIGVEVRVHNP